MVPVRIVRQLMEGSHEWLAGRIDDAVQANRQLFAESDSEEVARLATFDGKVIVGTEGGRYYSAVFEDKDGEIVFGEATPIDVPTVDVNNAAKAVRECTLSVVDALLSEDVSVAKDRILELASLHEQEQVAMARDYVAEVEAALAGERSWRKIFREQSEEIHRQVVDKLESIKESQLEAKYKPMYETDDIPEERFEDYRDLVNSDLSVLQDSLEQVHQRAEAAFFPFVESIADVELSEEETEVLGQFCAFSEDLIEDIHEIRGLLATSAQNEECVMCLGKIYDSIAEAMSSYEIATAFVERMVGAFDGAE